MKTAQHTYQDRITRTPGVVGGKPVVKGTRVPVDLILQYLAYDPNPQTLFEAFPHLTLEDVKACLAYAHRLLEKETRTSLAKESPHATL